MEVMKYHSTTHQLASTQLCEGCNPIILQVFLSDFKGEEALYSDWDFTNNERGKLIDDLEKEAEEEKAYNEWIDEINTATLETVDIREVERSLVGLVPVKPERAILTSYTYDHCAKGNECFHQQDYDKAIEHYMAAANRQWNDYVAFCLSLSYYLKGDYSNAVAVANRYNGSMYELPTFSRGMNAFVLSTTPIDKLNYLLERRMAS